MPPDTEELRVSCLFEGDGHVFVEFRLEDCEALWLGGELGMRNAEGAAEYQACGQHDEPFAVGLQLGQEPATIVRCLWKILSRVVDKNYCL